MYLGCSNIYRHVLQRSVWQICNSPALWLLSIMGAELAASQTTHLWGDSSLWSRCYQSSGNILYCWIKTMKCIQLEQSATVRHCWALEHAWRLIFCPVLSLDCMYNACKVATLVVLNTVIQDQGSQTCGLQAACRPRNSYLRPATTYFSCQNLALNSFLTCSTFLTTLFSFHKTRIKISFLTYLTFSAVIFFVICKSKQPLLSIIFFIAFTLNCVPHCL